MILPTKYLEQRESMLGLGAVLLKKLEKHSDVSSLWESVKDHPSVETYSRFLLALTMLYCLDLIDLIDEKIVVHNAS